MGIGTLGTLNDLTSRDVERMLRKASRGIPRDSMLLNGRKVSGVAYCHELVRSVAMELAGAIYDAAMRDNDNYEVWTRLCPDMSSKEREREWRKLMWPRLLDDARATLARMLAQPIDEGLKKRIHEAIILDGYLRKRGRGPKPLFRV